jgi:hypothetical protein
LSLGDHAEGVGLQYLWQELAVLTLMLVVLMLAAIRSFKARLSTAGAGRT